MRSAGAISRKLKEVRYRHIAAIFKNHFKRIPKNCRFNWNHAFVDGGGVRRELGLCLFDPANPTMPKQLMVNPSVVDVCQDIQACSRCNAFVYRYTKDDLKILFEEELKNPKTRSTKYPDICALEWVLERTGASSGFWKEIFEKIGYWIDKKFKGAL
jgi:hypothetical protein